MSKKSKKSRKNAGRLLPVIAGVAVIAAVAVVLIIPKNGKKAPVAAVGDRIVIRAEDLSRDEVLFFKPIEGKKIELLARIGDDGQAKVALGTCQSCNGSPGAYYTQEGSELKCNNCGLTFPVSVLDSLGGGCHPIMLDESIVEYKDGDILIDSEGLASYEVLFDKVEDH